MSFQDLATPNPPISSAESSVSLQIFKINSNVQGIRSLAEQIGTARDSSSLRARLRDLTETTRAVAQRASNDMQALVATVPPGPALRKLVSDLDASVRNLQAAQKFSATRQRANMVPAAPVFQEPAKEPLVDVSEDGPSQTQTQTLVYATEDAFREAEIHERHTAIIQLEHGMNDVSHIMQTLGNIVARQGGVIDDVEWNVQRTARDLERGADELEIAARHQRRGRRTCLTVILGVVCVVVIVAVLI
ncbi:t-SNARE [Mycena capillaripes]|nr:t-SNARE [Mycena capillaripes]